MSDTYYTPEGLTEEAYNISFLTDEQYEYIRSCAYTLLEINPHSTPVDLRNYIESIS